MRRRDACARSCAAPVRLAVTLGPHPIKRALRKIPNDFALRSHCQWLTVVPAVTSPIDASRRCLVHRKRDQDIVDTIRDERTAGNRSSERFAASAPDRHLPASGSMTRLIDRPTPEALREHCRGADYAALTDILGGFRKTRLCNQRQNFEIGAQTVRRCIRRRFPVGKRIAITPAQDQRLRSDDRPAKHRSSSVVSWRGQGWRRRIARGRFGYWCVRRQWVRRICAKRSLIPRGPVMPRLRHPTIWHSQRRGGGLPLPRHPTGCTMMPHQPANQGSPATNSFMKPSMANSV